MMLKAFQNSRNSLKYSNGVYYFSSKQYSERFDCLKKCSPNQFFSSLKINGALIFDDDTSLYRSTTKIRIRSADLCIDLYCLSNPIEEFSSINKNFSFFEIIDIVKKVKPCYIIFDTSLFQNNVNFTKFSWLLKAMSKQSPVFIFLSMIGARVSISLKQERFQRIPESESGFLEGLHVCILYVHQKGGTPSFLFVFQVCCYLALFLLFSQNYENPIVFSLECALFAFAFFASSFTLYKMFTSRELINASPFFRKSLNIFSKTLIILAFILYCLLFFANAKKSAERFDIPFVITPIIIFVFFLSLPRIFLDRPNKAR